MCSYPDCLNYQSMGINRVHIPIIQKTMQNTLYKAIMCVYFTKYILYHHNPTCVHIPIV